MAWVPLPPLSLSILLSPPLIGKSMRMKKVSHPNRFNSKIDKNYIVSKITKISKEISCNPYNCCHRPCNCVTVRCFQFFSRHFVQFLFRCSSSHRLLCCVNCQNFAALSKKYVKFSHKLGIVVREKVLKSLSVNCRI